MYLICPVARSSNVSLVLKRARLRVLCWAVSALAIAANKQLYGKVEGRREVGGRRLLRTPEIAFKGSIIVQYM